jgi:hypothetical protein
MTNTKFALLVSALMIAVVLLGLILGAVSAPAPAQVVAGSQAFILPAAYASRTMVVTTTAVGVSSFGFTTTDIATGVPQKAYITAYTGTLYYMFDGSSPDVATNSHMIAAGGQAVMIGAGNIVNLKLVSADAVTATITLEK